jgi:hypothetical protein
MRLAIAFLILLAACERPAPVAEGGPVPAPAPSQAPKAEPGELPAFAARGVGSRWELAIDDRRIIFSMPTAAGWRVVAKPEPTMTAQGTRYRTPYLQVDIAPKPCRNGSVQYSDTVTFAVDGGVFAGCGGPRAGEAGISDTPWEVLAVNGAAAPHDRFPIVLRFAPGRGVGGSVACNDFGIRRSFDGRAFGRGDPGDGAEMTAVGCLDAEGDALFRRLVPILYGVGAWRIEGDELLLEASGGDTIRLKRLL